MNAVCRFAGYFALCIGLIAEADDVSAFVQENQLIQASAPSHLLPGASTTPSANQQKYPELVDRVHREVNEFRRDYGLEPLTLNEMISEQASEHSSEMARIGKTITHRGFNERLENIRKTIAVQAAAENVATTSGHDDPARTVVEGWKNSADHRKNMLGDFSVTGIGVARSKNGGYFFTQIFVRPIK
jgi:uncharacterized protein YkwD